MKYILPKPYISWSAMDLWEKNPERFKREYFLGGKKLDTRFLRFGKWIARIVEELCEIQKRTGSKDEALKELAILHSLDQDTIEAIAQLETDGISEYDIKCEINGVQILSYVDKYVPEHNYFREYKTGKHAWTKAKVEDHGQLVFYAVGLRKKIGKMPTECYLDWLETSEDPKESTDGDFWARTDRKLRLTGKVKTFHKLFDERELDRMEERIVKAAEGISAAYKLFISEI